MRFWSFFVSLAVFWVLVSGQVDPAHDAYLMGVGLACCLAVAWIAWRMGVVDEEGHPVGFLIRLAGYAPWLLAQVMLSNLDVARRVWHPRPRQRIAPRVIRVPHRLVSGFGIATYANSITLTPGTVTVAVEKDHMVVHALHEAAARSLEEGAMHERVRRLEGGA